MDSKHYCKLGNFSEFTSVHIVSHDVLEPEVISKSLMVQKSHHLLSLEHVLRSQDDQHCKKVDFNFFNLIIDPKSKFSHAFTLFNLFLAIFLRPVSSSSELLFLAIFIHAFTLNFFFFDF